MSDKTPAEQIRASHVDLLGREGEEREVMYLMRGKVVSVGEEDDISSFCSVERDIHTFIDAGTTTSRLGRILTESGFSIRKDWTHFDAEDYEDEEDRGNETDLDKDGKRKTMKTVYDAACYLWLATRHQLYTHILLGQDGWESTPIGFVKQVGNRLVIAYGERVVGGNMSDPGTGTEGKETRVTLFRPESEGAGIPVLFPEVEFVLRGRDIGSVITYYRDGKVENDIFVTWQYLPVKW